MIFLLKMTMISAAPTSKNELIILLHGLFNSKIMMRGMARFLAKAGFEVLNIDYPSTKHKIEDLAPFVKNILDQNKLHQFEKVHFMRASD